MIRVYHHQNKTEFLYLSLIGIILRWGFLIWELIFIYCGLFVLILVVFLGFFCCFFFHYVSAKFYLWPSSGDLPRPRIGMLSLVTVSPVITAKLLSIAPRFWPSKPLTSLGRIWNRYLLTMFTRNRRDSMPLSAAPRAPKGDQGWIFFFFFGLINPYLVFQSRVHTEFFLYLPLIGIILRWGFLIWELIFIYCRLFVLILVVFFFVFFFQKWILMIQ